MTATKKDFAEVEGRTVARMAAHYRIKTMERNHQNASEISIKYQVLAASTAIVGVIKRPKGEPVKEVEIKKVTINNQFLRMRNM